MKLKTVRSGGQTGADQAGLRCAKALGLQTAGWAPKGWKTDAGPAPWLADYGLREHTSADYPPRTRQNVLDAEATVWFGKVSPGFWCTKKAADLYACPFIANPSPEEFKLICEQYEDINIAGNRRRINPGAEHLVEQAFAALDPK